MQLKSRTNLISIGVLLVISLAMFADVLFNAEVQVLSRFQTDLSRQFVHWRNFGISELSQGNLPLWNPYIFSGTPFFPGFQSALLYPPNWLYLVLPLHNAINVGIVLHIFLGGIFMYSWAGYREINIWGRLLSALLFMFCGAHYMHVYAGHLPNLCAIVWAPLIFLSIDGLFDKGKLGWVMLGIFAVSMQILAGHPQYVYYTALGAGIYVILHTVAQVRKARQNEIDPLHGLLRRVVGIAAIFLGASAVTAVQLFPGLQVAGESVRGQGLNYDFCAMFSFPPENILTFVAPCIFGDTMDMPYWGRWFLWEMSVFISIGGLVMAVCGSIWGQKHSRRLCLPMAIVLTILALGTYTPLFDLLFHLMPGFDRFRGTSKFMFLTSMFLTLLSGAGFDWLLNQSSKSSANDAVDRAIKRSGQAPLRLLPLVVLGAGLVLFSAAMFVKTSSPPEGDSSLWHAQMEKMSKTKGVYINAKAFDYPPFIAKAGLTARRSLIFAACTLFLLSVILFFIPYIPLLAYLVGIIAVVEVLVFAYHFKASFNLDDVRPRPELHKFLSELSGDDRIFWPDGDPNQGMLTRAPGIWGEDPVVSLRYAQFMAFTQKGNPDRATQHVIFRRYHRLYSMLRCRYLITKARLKETALSLVLKAGEFNVYQIPGPLPRLLLVENFLVRNNRDEILSHMSDPKFDPRKTVILEQTPDPAPHGFRKGSRPGEVKVLESSTDSLVVDVELSRPAILVITDGYYSGWRVTGKTDSDQQGYNILPANYILRAVPLAVGKHTLTIEYLPFAFRMGIWISVITVVIYQIILLCLFLKRHGFRDRNPN